MPGLIVKKLQEDESMSEDDYDSDADDDDSDDADDGDTDADDDDKNACALEERLANIERMHKQIWLVIETKAKDTGINITEILAQFHEPGPAPTQESSIEERLTNFEMKWRHTLLVTEVVFKAMGTDGTEILAKLAEVRARLSASHEPRPTPASTNDAPAQVVEDVVADQMTVLDDTTVDTDDSTFCPPTLAPAVSTVDVPPVFVAPNAAATADTPNSAVYLALASLVPVITAAAVSIPPAEAGDTPMPDTFA